MKNSVKYVILASAFVLSVAMSSIIALLPNMAQAAVSGQNGKIVFNRLDDPEDGFDVFSINSDGSSYTNITNDGASAYSNVSRDGSKITYMAFAGETYDIVIADSTGNNRQVLTQGYYPRFSPDGTKIIYGAPADEDVEWAVINTDGTGQTNLGIAPSFGNDMVFANFVAWSPDSTKIAFAEVVDNMPQIFVMNSNGTGRTQLTTGVGLYANFSNDGTKIYYVGINEGTEMVGLYSTNVDGSGSTKLFDLPGGFEPYEFFISPDENKFLYADGNPDIEAIDVYTGNMDGSDVTKILDDMEIQDVPAVFNWSPDSTKLAFSMFVDDQADVFTVNSDGSGLTNLTNTPQYFEVFLYSSHNWASTPGGAVEDSDGVDSGIENAAPNQGDANNDGIPDSQQPHVTSLPLSSGPNAGTYISLSAPSGTTITAAALQQATELASQDTAFDYTLGLTAFTVEGVTPGSTIPIELYYYTSQSPDSLTPRKYNPNTQAFTTLSTQTETTLTQETINNQPVLKLSYQLTDGGTLDLDNQANGTIEDPVGLASQTTGSANTGLQTHWLLGVRN